MTDIATAAGLKRLNATIQNKPSDQAPDKFHDEYYRRVCDALLAYYGGGLRCQDIGFVAQLDHVAVEVRKWLKTDPNSMETIADIEAALNFDPRKITRRQLAEYAIYMIKSERALTRIENPHALPRAWEKCGRTHLVLITVCSYIELLNEVDLLS